MYFAFEVVWGLKHVPFGVQKVLDWLCSHWDMADAQNEPSCEDRPSCDDNRPWEGDIEKGEDSTGDLAAR